MLKRLGAQTRTLKLAMDMNPVPLTNSLSTTKYVISHAVQLVTLGGMPVPGDMGRHIHTGIYHEVCAL